MISIEEVKHIAKLARLELSEEEITKMQKDLTAILDYFNLLKKAPKIKVEKVIAKNSDWQRKDEASTRKAETVEKIIAASPDKKDDYLKVKTIL